MSVPRCLIAAPASGAGKTTFAVGLMAALRAHGLNVAPFKAGPDYIDPGYLTLAARRPCHNLDAWLLPPERVRVSFAHHAAGADIAVIEGVMGLFDGYSGVADAGSTAHLARLLEAPVVLVVDVSAMARSAAALVRGFRDFEARVRLAGVLLNRVGSPAHAALVKAAVEAETGLPVLGFLAADERWRLPERHLGLVTAPEAGDRQTWLEALRAEFEACVDVERMLELAASAPDLPEADSDLFAGFPAGPPVVIAVAHDLAFNFIYEDNLDLLRAAGAEIAFFSPLESEALPRGARAVYLCGGYPELWAAQLAANERLKAELRAAHAAGLPIYAECGGLMYLTETITDAQGVTHPMVGLLPGGSVLTPRLTLGYRSLRALSDSWLWRAGETGRGHEFHHSVWQGRPATLPYLYEHQPDVFRAGPGLEGARLGNLLASYTHLHFLSRPELAARFVAAARAGVHTEGVSECPDSRESTPARAIKA